MREGDTAAPAGADWSALRRAAEKAIASGNGPAAQLLVRLAQACWHLQDTDAAYAAAADALAIDPSLSEAEIICAWAATERGDGETALGHYRALARLNPDKVKWQLQVIRLLNKFGNVSEAVEALDKVQKRWPGHPMVRLFSLTFGPGGAPLPAAASDGAARDPARLEEAELQALMATAPGDGALARLLMTDDPARDVIIAPAHDPAAIVLVFTAANDRLTFPLPIFDRYLSALNATAVYVKDFRRLRFMKGVQSLGDDYDSTLAALRKIVAGLGHARLHAIGNCEGGFAAIRYGGDLGADRILAFKTPTHVTPESKARIEQSRNVLHARLKANVPDALMDLKPFIETRAQQSRIEIFYEAADPRDSTHALHLVNVPGVTLHPQPGSHGYKLLRWLALQSGFGDRLGHLLGMKEA